MSKQFLSSRVKNMATSATIEMSSKSRKLREEGLDIINLSLGEPDFNTPDVIKQSAINAIHDNYSKYTPIAGFDELKQAISNKFKRENNLNYKKMRLLFPLELNNH